MPVSGSESSEDQASGSARPITDDREYSRSNGIDLASGRSEPTMAKGIAHLSSRPTPVVVIWDHPHHIAPASLETVHFRGRQNRGSATEPPNTTCRLFVSACMPASPPVHCDLSRWPFGALLRRLREPRCSVARLVLGFNN